MQSRANPRRLSGSGLTDMQERLTTIGLVRGTVDRTRRDACARGRRHRIRPPRAPRRGADGPSLRRVAGVAPADRKALGELHGAGWLQGTTRAGELRGGRTDITVVRWARALRHDWTLTGFVFADDLSFSGTDEHRTLKVTFADVPLALPADAVFSHLEGSSQDLGLGIGVSHFVGSGFLSGWRWTAGALWRRLDLGGYSTPYQVLAGRSAGATGLLDYSVQYSFATPYGGLSRALPSATGPSTAFHDRGAAAKAWRPGPDHGQRIRRQWQYFGLRSQQSQQAGAHLSMAVRYEPWGLEVDLGARVLAALLEAVLHPVDRNIAISVA